LLHKLLLQELSLLKRLQQKLFLHHNNRQVLQALTKQAVQVVMFTTQQVMLVRLTFMTQLVIMDLTIIGNSDNRESLE